MNIFLIVSDTFRYDNLFDRAAMPVRTPNLDAFAERAVSVERFYTGSFPTIPQRTDMTAGRYGWPWYGWQNWTRSTENHMPIVLRQAGYVSQLICDCPHLFNAGFNQGFDAAETLRGQEGDLPFTQMNHPIETVMPPEKTRLQPLFHGHPLVDKHRWAHRLWRLEEDRFPPRTARRAVEWLEENGQFDPLFLWVDFFDPHEPWDPPEYMVKRYDPDYDGVPMLHPNYGKASDYTPAELRNLRAHYCAEAELVDRWVGRVLQKIDDLALWDNSIVVFTSDHGFSIGERNRTGKSNISPGDDHFWPIYPEVAHVPFMIAAPGLEGGRTVDGYGQPVDILPTLIDLAGIDVEPSQPFHGKSLAPALRGECDKTPNDFAVSGSFLRADESGGVPAKSVTPVLYSKKWIYVPVGPEGQRELFDAQDDPGAERNVAGDHRTVVNDLHEALLAWLKEMDAPPEAVQVLE